MHRDDRADTIQMFKRNSVVKHDEITTMESIIGNNKRVQNISDPFYNIDDKDTVINFNNESVANSFPSNEKLQNI